MKTIFFLIFTLFVFVNTPLANSPSHSPNVFVSLEPQKWLAEQLIAQSGKVSVLVAPGQDPHDFSPSPKQLMALSGASLYFTVDLEFEKRVIHKISHTASGVKFVDTSIHVQKIPMVPHQHEHDSRKPHSDHKKEEHHEHEINHHHDIHEDHGANEHEGLDPHIWLSTTNLKIMAQTMADALIATDPANTSLYAENLKKLKTELDRLNAKFTDQLTPYYGRTFYVFHPAFGYFARDYHLQQRAVEVEGKSPTPKQLSHLIEMAKKDKVQVIFVQPQFDAKSAKAVAQAINGKVVPLNPLAYNVAANLQTMADNIEAALQ